MESSGENAELILSQWDENGTDIVCVWTGPANEHAVFRGTIQRSDSKVAFVSDRLMLDLSDFAQASFE